jgi:PAS domain S-box-containing protein
MPVSRVPAPAARLTKEMPLLFQYGLAFVGVAVATLLRVPLEAFFHGRAPYALYYLPILVTAWYGGMGPALTATGLSLLSAWYLFIPRSEPGQAATVFLFLAVSAAMALFARAARQAREAARRSVDVAERSAEEAASLAAIVESSDDAIITKDLDGIIRTWNPAAERILGYAPIEIVGRPITTLIPPDRQAEERKILDHVRRGERVDHYETVRVAKGGRLLHASITVSPVRDRSGVIVGASKILRDISARLRAEQALSAQREWFRVTLSSIGDAVITCDRDAKITFVNAVAAGLTGWPPEEALGRPLSEVFHIVNEKTRQAVANPIELVLRSGHTVGLANHTVLIRRAGAEIPIEDSASPILDDSGRVVGVVLVFHDVTERRRAEEALAEQKEWFERTLESIGDAVIATDVRGEIVFMNPVAEHLTGCRIADVRGRSCDEVFRVVNEHTRQPAQSPVHRVLTENVVVGLANHTVLIAADGSERPIDDSGAPIRNRSGRITGVVLVFRDVSERRRAETDRAAAVSERERLLESERHARAEAERSSRLKDEFVAMVSHELRTPLNAILGWAQILGATTEAAEVQLGVEVIQRNTRLQAQLISDLLDISRIVSGKLRLDLGEVDLSAMVRHAAQSAQTTAEAKQIELEWHVAAASLTTTGDAARLHQCLSNLLSNAIKFTPAGGRVNVSLRRIDGHAEIRVTDTGVGIRPDFLPLVFERFQQAESQTTRRFGGLGLGLAIVKQLIELHGGRVQAASGGEGKGATFTLEVPIIDVQHRKESRAGAADAQEDAGTTLEGMTVLVVEDDADTRDLVKRLLEGEQASVLVAASATEALDLLETQRPDVLVSDIGLPDIDGYTLIQRIRDRGAAQGGAIPAVALTAYARSEDRTKALRAGYQAHISKPVEPADLIEAVASFAGLVRVRQSD